MIGFTRRVRVFACAKPADKRKQYDGLYALVVSEMKADPLSGDLFLFTNRRRTRPKVLLWDGTGLCLYLTDHTGDIPKSILVISRKTAPSAPSRAARRPSTVPRNGGDEGMDLARLIPALSPSLAEGGPER